MTGADELAIFTLSKIYQRHTVIFNTSKPWTTLEPDGEMLETELYEHCQNPTWHILVNTSMPPYIGNYSVQ